MSRPRISKKVRIELLRLCEKEGKSPEEARKIVNKRYGVKIGKSLAYSIAPVGGTQTGNRLSPKASAYLDDLIREGRDSTEINRIMQAVYGSGAVVAKSTISYRRSKLKEQEEKEMAESKKDYYRGRIPGKVKKAIVLLNDEGFDPREIAELIDSRFKLWLSENQIAGAITGGDRKPRETKAAATPPATPSKRRRQAAPKKKASAKKSGEKAPARKKRSAKAKADKAGDMWKIQVGGVGTVNPGSVDEACERCKMKLDALRKQSREAFRGIEAEIDRAAERLQGLASGSVTLRA